ncbi:DUF551 domain-containing protein [Providencia rettgeri]
MQGTNWVKCSDKMPEKDVRVMAIWNGMPTILCLFSITGLWDDGDFYSCIPLEDVTHWMPLCSGQLKLATVLEFFRYWFSDSFGGNPPLYSCGLTSL